MKISSISIIAIFLLSSILNAQDPKRFQKEIDTIDLTYKSKVNMKDLIVFTGSSSIRRWKNIGTYFPGKNIINTGFGGSQMSDLVYYSDSVITKYKPVQVFIYEGDNDVAAGKKVEEIVKDAEGLFNNLTNKIPGIQIVIISVKPSVSRWKLKDEYLKLNKGYRNFSMTNKNVKYIDVWNPLLDENGIPKKEIFISDSLHINKIGYDIWAKKISEYIR
jgi:lysophospholipase L1-like esterase